MTFWERSTDLGKLEILEVYEYYDQPVLLACRSASGSRYLVVAVDADNNAEHWLSVAVSKLRFEAIRSGGVDLNTAFSSPEDGRVFHFAVPRDQTAPVVFKNLSSADLPPEWLPAQNAKIELPTSTLPALHDIKTEAVQSRRDLFGIKLAPVGTTRNEASASLAGKVLQSIQDTMNALAQSLDAELMFVRVGGGSFEMLLASADQVGPLNESAITNASQELGRLVQLAEDDDAFRQHIARLKPEVADAYLSFLRAIEDRVTETTVEWASPNLQQPPGRSVIHNDRVKTSIIAMVDIHETKRFEVVGKLMTSSVRNNTFEFQPDEPVSGVAFFTGKASAEALDPAKRNAPGNRFTATIEEVRKLKGSNQYTLLLLTPLA